MPDVVTSALRAIASIAARKSATATAAAGSGIGAAADAVDTPAGRGAVASPHHDQRGEAAAGIFESDAVIFVRGHRRAIVEAARRAVAEQRQRVALGLGRPDQERLQPLRPGLGHRDTQILGVELRGHRIGRDASRREPGHQNNQEPLKQRHAPTRKAPIERP